MQIRHFSPLKIISSPYGSYCFKFQPNDTTCPGPLQLLGFSVLRQPQVVGVQCAAALSPRSRPPACGPPPPSSRTSEHCERRLAKARSPPLFEDGPRGHWRWVGLGLGALPPAASCLQTPAHVLSSFSSKNAGTTRDVSPRARN